MTVPDPAEMELCPLIAYRQSLRDHLDALAELAKTGGLTPIQYQEAKEKSSDFWAVTAVLVTRLHPLAAPVLWRGRHYSASPDGTALVITDAKTGVLISQWNLYPPIAPWVPPPGTRVHAAFSTN